MPRSTHGNSNKSRRKHHLYEIRDKVKDDVYKYGICGDPLNKDGSSPRGNKQVRLFNNLVEWSRFFARVLLTGIPGRRRAKEIETEYIERYRQKHGKPPRGNRD